MLDYEKNWVRLPLKNASNVREIGGYPVKDGGQTVYRRFLRADDISALTDEDVDFLLGYGVRMVVDLRSDVEAEKFPDRLMGIEGVEYVRIPFLGRDVTDATQVRPEDLETGLGTLYAGMLENKEVSKEIFEAIENAPEGCVLFHCSAGKDRTGVLAMLLMSLAGADRQDCMTNYAQSYTNLCRKPEFANINLDGAHAKYGSMMYSMPETIGECYDLMMERYGSTENYLKSCGLKEEQIERIKERLVVGCN